MAQPPTRFAKPSSVRSMVRMWSTNVQGNQIDFEKFKATIDGK